jgi:hypothetical protein
VEPRCQASGWALSRLEGELAGFTTSKPSDLRQGRGVVIREPRQASLLHPRPRLTSHPLR